MVYKYNTFIHLLERTCASLYKNRHPPLKISKCIWLIVEMYFSFQDIHMYICMCAETVKINNKKKMQKG